MGRLYFFSLFLWDCSDLFELSDFDSDFELSDFEELSALEESSDLAFESLLEAESPFDEDEAEPVEDFLA